jgi:hypothetical protein
MSYYRHNRRSNNRFKSAQHDNIDRQILCLHQAMAKKLLADQSYLPQIIDTIESRHKSGKIGYGSYLFWTSLLEHIKHYWKTHRLSRNTVDKLLLSVY